VPLRTRRWIDPGDAADDLRVLVCRYRPRGVKKADETWDVWWPELGPSRELHAAVYGKGGNAPLAWFAFARRYRAEMPARSARLAEIRERLAKGEAVALLCSSACGDESRCHRSLLRAALEG
jgi:uncharacterized protein YeaO (DUF488 family)